MKPRSVTVSSPYREASVQHAVEALAAQGVLRDFLVPLDLAGARRHAASLPGSQAVDRLLTRRSFRHATRSVAPLREVMVTALYRLGGRAQAPLEWRASTLDNSVAAIVRSDPPSAFIGMPYASLESFKAARESRALTVFNHVNANLRTENTIFRAETQGQPQRNGEECWSKSIIERVDREVELADVVLTPSTFVRRDLIDRGVDCSKLVLLPYGVDTTLFRPLTNRCFRDRVRLLHVGQVGHRKGLRYLLAALAEMDDHRFELTVVGPIVNRNIEVRRTSTDVCYRGVLSREQLVQLYSECDAFILPSLAEGMALVVLEAMACGAPVVVTEACGYEGIVRNGVEGFVVPPRDVGALKEAIRQLADRSVRQQMSEAAYARAQEYTWDRFKEDFLEALALAMARQQQGVVA